MGAEGTTTLNWERVVVQVEIAPITNPAWTATIAGLQDRIFMHKVRHFAVEWTQRGARVEMPWTEVRRLAEDRRDGKIEISDSCLIRVLDRLVAGCWRLREEDGFCAWFAGRGSYFEIALADVAGLNYYLTTEDDH